MCLWFARQNIAVIMRTNVFANYVNYNGIGKYIIRYIYYAKPNEVAKTVWQKNLKKLKKTFKKCLTPYCGCSIISRLSIRAARSLTTE